MDRRAFVGALATLPLGAALSAQQKTSAPATAAIRPRHLSAGDTVALVAPASATFQTLDLDIARESLEALGLKVKVGEHVLAPARLPGRRRQGSRRRHQPLLQRRQHPRRAADPRRLGQQPRAAAPRLRRDPPQSEDRPRLQRHHRTASSAIHAKTGLVTFHGPNGMGRWDTLVGRVRQARAVQRRSGDVRESASAVGSQLADPDREPRPDASRPARRADGCSAATSP